VPSKDAVNCEGYLASVTETGEREALVEALLTGEGGIARKEACLCATFSPQIPREITWD
jgi:hypothetical protein